MIWRSTIFLPLFLGSLCIYLKEVRSEPLTKEELVDNVKSSNRQNIGSGNDMENLDYVSKAFSYILNNQLKDSDILTSFFSNTVDGDLIVNLASSIVDLLVLKIGLVDSYSSMNLIVEALLSVATNGRPEEYCKNLTNVTQKILLNNKILNSENYFTLAYIVSQIIENAASDLLNNRKILARRGGIGAELGVAVNKGVSTGLDVAGLGINTAADIKANGGFNTAADIGLGVGVPNLNVNADVNSLLGSDTNLNFLLKNDLNSNVDVDANTNLSVSEEAILQFKSKLTNELLKDKYFRYAFSDYVPSNALKQVAGAVCQYISKAFAISRSFLLPLENSIGSLSSDSTPSPELYANIITEELINLFRNINFITKRTASLQASITANAITSGVASFVRLYTIPGLGFNVMEDNKNYFNSYFSILNGLEKLSYVGVEAASLKLPTAIKLRYASIFASQFTKSLIYNLAPYSKVLETFCLAVPTYVNKIIAKSLGNFVAEAFGSPNPNLFYDLYYEALLTSAVNLNSLNFVKAISFATARALFLNGYFLSGNINIQAAVAKNAIIQALTTKIKPVTNKVALFPNVLRLPWMTEMNGVLPLQILLKYGIDGGVSTGIDTKIGLDKNINAINNEALQTGMSVKSGLGTGIDINSSLKGGAGINADLGMGYNTGLGAVLNANAGLGGALGTNTGLGARLGTDTNVGTLLGGNTDLGAGLDVNAGLGIGRNFNNNFGAGKSMNNGLGAILGINSDLGTGLGINAGLRGLGGNTGLGGRLGVNGGLGTGLDINSGLGAGLDSNIGLRTGLGSNAGLRTGIGINQAIGTDGINSDLASRVNANAGLPGGLNVNAGLGTNLGANALLGAGYGSNLGSNALLGTGLGANAALGANLGANARLGANAALGTNVGANALLGGGLGANADLKSNIGANSAFGLSSGANYGLGANLGSNAQIGSGQTANTGFRLNLGENAGLRTGLDGNTGLRTGLGGYAGLGAGLGGNAGLGAGLSGNAGLGANLGANAALGAGVAANTGLGANLWTGGVNADGRINGNIGIDNSGRLESISRNKRSADPFLLGAPNPNLNSKNNTNTGLDKISENSNAAMQKTTLSSTDIDSNANARALFEASSDAKTKYDFRTGVGANALLGTGVDGILGRGLKSTVGANANLGIENGLGLNADILLGTKTNAELQRNYAKTGLINSLDVKSEFEPKFASRLGLDRKLNFATNRNNVNGFNTRINLGIPSTATSDIPLSISNVLPLILANKLYQSTALYTSISMVGANKVINLIAQAMAYQFGLPLATLFLRSYEQHTVNNADNTFELNTVGLAIATTEALGGAGILNSKFLVSTADQLADAIVAKYSSLIVTSLEAKESNARSQWTYRLNQNLI